MYLIGTTLQNKNAQQIDINEGGMFIRVYLVD
jgi:hypothetical protein